MKKLKINLEGMDMLTKEQMKQIGGGVPCTCFAIYCGLGGDYYSFLEYGDCQNGDLPEIEWQCQQQFMVVGPVMCDCAPSACGN